MKARNRVHHRLGGDVNRSGVGKPVEEVGNPSEPVFQHQQRFRSKAAAIEHRAQDDGALGNEKTPPADEVTLANITIGLDPRIQRICDYYRHHAAEPFRLR